MLFFFPSFSCFIIRERAPQRKQEGALQIESAAAADVLALSTNQLCSSSSSESLPPRADAALRLLQNSSRSFPPPPPLLVEASYVSALPSFKYSSPPLDRLFVARTRSRNRRYLCLSACLPRPLVPPDFIWVSLQVRLSSAALFKREKGGKEAGLHLFLALFSFHCGR